MPWKIGSFWICSALPSAVRRLFLFVGVNCSVFLLATGLFPPAAPVLAGELWNSIGIRSDLNDDFSLNL
ncbi:hypothetical protein SLEP1_g22172 [Rubroshorea leprosula]|uniref:Uncharacterized protein n=1 Tax=Rubroshorea leprosula TaxID=152421 RepID=A0AAV5JH74_9ROSI|nr:hypothetical protein SLEP1_g22172 [Rubroshorea leprosula]